MSEQVVKVIGTTDIDVGMKRKGKKVASFGTASRRVFEGRLLPRNLVAPYLHPQMLFTTLELLLKKKLYES